MVFSWFSHGFSMVFKRFNVILKRFPMLSVSLCRRNEVVAVFDDWGLGYADGISSAGGPQKLLISEKEGLFRGF